MTRHVQRRAIRVAVALALAGLLGACVPSGTDVERQLCSVGGQLSMAVATVERAITAEAAGNHHEADAFASVARGRAESAHGSLEGVATHAGSPGPSGEIDTVAADQVRALPSWQGLLEAYDHVAQAANAFSLEPEAHVTARDQLQLATNGLRSAAGELPAGCFGVPAPTPAA